MSSRWHQVGVKGEGIATTYLEKNQYKILERNYRTRRGEIDIIALEEDPLATSQVLVFVEVKARKELSFGAPEEAITTQKMERIRRAAEVYLLKNDLEDVDCRFDVIGIVITPEGYTLEHEKDVLDY